MVIETVMSSNKVGKKVILYKKNKKEGKQKKSKLIN